MERNVCWKEYKCTDNFHLDLIRCPLLFQARYFLRKFVWLSPYKDSCRPNTVLIPMCGWDCLPFSIANWSACMQKVTEKSIEIGRARRLAWQQKPTRLFVWRNMKGKREIYQNGEQLLIACARTILTVNENSLPNKCAFFFEVKTPAIKRAPARKRPKILHPLTVSVLPSFQKLRYSPKKWAEYIFLLRKWEEKSLPRIQSSLVRPRLTIPASLNWLEVSRHWKTLPMAKG